MTLQLNQDQKKYLLHKVEYYQKQVDVFTKDLKESASDLDNDEYLETRTRRINYLSESLNNYREALKTLSLIQDALEEGEDTRRKDFAFRRALTMCAKIEDEHTRVSVMEILIELTN